MTRFPSNCRLEYLQSMNRFVIRTDDTTTYYAYLSYGTTLASNGKTSYCIYDIIVDREFRNRGFASGLLEHALKIFKADPLFENAFLYIEPLLDEPMNTEQLRLFYKKYGFTTCKTDPLKMILTFAENENEKH